MQDGDPLAIAALLAKSPEIAAQQILRALSGLPAGTPSPLDGTAELLLAHFQRLGDQSAAGRLASALAHRSPRFRLAHALAAFARGDDAEAERAASADPAVLAVMTPLLDAARPPTAAAEDGAPPAKSSSRARKTKAPPDTRPPALRSLHAVAQAAAAARRRNLRGARQAIHSVVPDLRGEVLADAMSAALDLAGASLTGARLDDAAATLMQVGIHDKAVAKALTLALARRDEDRAEMVGSRLGLSSAALGAMGVTGAAQRRPGAPAKEETPMQAALQLAERAGADAFPEEHRAAACLYEGFACIHTDSKRAGRAFDRAIQLGADLLEALRGKLLLAMADPKEPCPDCGRVHDADHDASPRDVALAADRLARAARHVPEAAPFAAAASTIAANAWDDEGDTKAELASIEAARAAASASPATLAQLDLMEAQAIADSRPDRAAALLGRVLARDPAHVNAWKLKIDMAVRAGDAAATASVVQQAAAATGDPQIAGMARTLAFKAGKGAPFEGLVPGSVTAGALVADAVEHARLEGPARELPPAALACRAALQPVAQVAFDVAYIAALSNAGKKGDAARQLAAAIEAWWTAPPMLAKLAAMTWILELKDALVPAARHLASQPDAGPALAALCDAALAAEDLEVAAGLLPLGGALWSRAELQERRRAMDRIQRAKKREDAFGFGSMRASRRKAGGAAGPEEVAGELDAALSPEIPPGALWGESPEEIDFPGPGGLDGGGGLADHIFRMLGIPPAVAARLSMGQLAEIQRLAELAARDAFSTARLEQLKRDIQKVIRRQ